jgi:NADPH:quinone reductase-like Zn-dependent oxidoreductase
MKQSFIVGHGGTHTLQVRESADPVPHGSDVRIRVRAAGVNFADVLARQGLYPDAPKPPFVVGYEVAGIVDATGPNAQPGWIGREVFALTRFGGYADTVVVTETQVFDKPATLTFEQAAALSVNYLTAWQLLVVVGSLAPTDTVLIHNAGGGVGLASIDIARHIGARIIGTASSRKHAFLQQRGVHDTIDYGTQDWPREIRRLTNDRGVELVIDPLGGSHWKKSYNALRHTGRLGMFGISAATESGWMGPLRLAKVALAMPLFHPIFLVNRNRSVFGVNLGHLWHESEKIRAWMAVLLTGVAEGWVRPHVDRSFSLDQAGQAHAYLENRQNIGKVVLTTRFST